MKASTFSLLVNEIRMLFNHLKRTITTPSMFSFYAIMLVGTYFVSSIIAVLGSYEPLFVGLTTMIEATIDRSMVMSALGLVSLTAVVGGYLGRGPSAELTETDEYIMMPIPASPYQLFLTKYLRRILRKLGFAFLGLLVILPLVSTSNLLLIPLGGLIVCFIGFMEVNYFLGGISFQIRSKLDRRFKTPFKHFILLFLALAVYIPTLPEATANPILSLLIPSNAFAYIAMELTGVFAYGLGPLIGVLCLCLSYPITFLMVANSVDQDYYERFALKTSNEGEESRISRMVRGEVDFSESRYNDPLMWVLLKDFWSKMRKPFQFWKYIYFFIGVAIALYLNIVRPIWLPPLIIPPELSNTAVPAFLLILILVTQMASVSALLSFIDEKENIYLLKSSPFKASDIVLAKYFLSLVEVTLTVAPIVGFLAYFMRVQGSFYLLTLVAPLVLIFSATGVMVGAYVPVFTNEPGDPPVPLAFGFPAINIGFGSLLMAIVALYAEDMQLVQVMPAFVVVVVLGLLALATIALRSYK
ncbi:MAG: hypothetical protein KAU89_04775 [Candidatus Thorarchaeota archaeon]|nr:hypothetical protein [Candidatus Thorarchaeota archaeon]